MKKLSAEYLRSILSYDPETGNFVWKSRPREHFATLNAYSVWNSRCAGKRAGCSSSRYLQIGIDGKRYAEHSLAWLYMTGQWPVGEIDHINLDKHDNRFANLRLATRKENGRNIALLRTNKSGCKGVFWNSNAKRWQAAIRVDGRRIYLGTHECINEAATAYAKAARLYHGEFARI